jgi:hypothetical protein
MAEDPLSTVVLGAAKCSSNFELLRKISLDWSSLHHAAYDAAP